LFIGYISVFEIKVYMMYYYLLLLGLEMGVDSRAEEIRWQVIKAVLDEFPVLKERVRAYLEED
jgi:hypothetical protein